jgi:hypothetical protein
VEFPIENSKELTSGSFVTVFRQVDECRDIAVGCLHGLPFAAHDILRFEAIVKVRTQSFGGNPVK